MALPQKLNWDLAQTAWATEINPLIAFAPTKGLLLKDIAITAAGPNVVNHRLGRKMQGWMIIDKDADASIYRSAPLNNLTITLTSDADVTISLWVF
jgi:hypothetical protein